MLRNSLRFQGMILVLSKTAARYICMYRMMNMHYNTFIWRGIYLFVQNTLRITPSRMHDLMIYVSPFEINASSFW